MGSGNTLKWNIDDFLGPGRGGSCLRKWAKETLVSTPSLTTSFLCFIWSRSFIWGAASICSAEAGGRVCVLPSSGYCKKYPALLTREPEPWPSAGRGPADAPAPTPRSCLWHSLLLLSESRSSPHTSCFQNLQWCWHVNKISFYRVSEIIFSWRS